MPHVFSSFLIISQCDVLIFCLLLCVWRQREVESLIRASSLKSCHAGALSRQTSLDPTPMSKWSSATWISIPPSTYLTREFIFYRWRGVATTTDVATSPKLLIDPILDLINTQARSHLYHQTWLVVHLGCHGKGLRCQQRTQSQSERFWCCGNEERWYASFEWKSVVGWASVVVLLPTMPYSISLFILFFPLSMQI